MKEVDKAVAASKAVNDAYGLEVEPTNRADLPDVKTPDLGDVLTVQLDPWEQLADEPGRAWKAFIFYRDLGPGRTLAAVAKTDEVQASSSFVNKVSHDFEWARRVAAWDLAEDRIYKIRRHEEIKQMAERHGSMIVDAIKAMSAPFEALKLKFEEDPLAIRDLSEKDTLKLLDTASKMARNLPGLMASERAARGMATEVIEIRGEVTHTHDFTRDHIGGVLAALESSGAIEPAQPGRLEDGESDRRASGDDLEIVDAELVEVHTDDTVS